MSPARERRVTWRTQKETAEDLGISTRWLQELGDRGLPSRGQRDSREYPWPDVGLWWAAYKIREARGERVKRLDMDVARAEHEVFLAEEELRRLKRAAAERRE